MKIYLLFKDKDISKNNTLCMNYESLLNDLALDPIIETMANNDTVIKKTITDTLNTPLQTIEEIKYRQEVLVDCLTNKAIIIKLYAITTETLKEQKRMQFWISDKYINGVLISSIDLLKIYIQRLAIIRTTLQDKHSNFKSVGFIRLISMIESELDDTYIKDANEKLDELRKYITNKDGILVSSNLGSFCQGTNYILRKKEKDHFKRTWRNAKYFRLAERDDSGAKDLNNKKDRATVVCANILGNTSADIFTFFEQLQRELSFYIGCINLQNKMSEYKMPVCIPKMTDSSLCNRSWDQLYDIGLVITKKTSVITNTCETSDTNLILITGANQGGKTTFLRSFGAAQLMMQCGMFVGAKTYTAPIRTGIFTHFKQEEDTSQTSGKLDEELQRMQSIITIMDKKSLILFNESFSSTNDREGSEICRQITQALLEHEVEICSVTHLLSYAQYFLHKDRVLFLKAERLENKNRTFKIIKGEPFISAYGNDIWEKVFYIS
jgi:DNA mismatch repair ATPase MutS